MTIALWAVLEGGSHSRRLAYLGGICAGFSVASEYPAIIAAAVLFLYLAYADRDRAVRFGLAMIPGLSLIMLKNTVSTQYRGLFFWSPILLMADCRRA